MNKNWKVKDVIRLIQDDGWRQVRQTGSHRIFHHPTKRGIVIVSGRMGRTIPRGTMSAILKQAVLKSKRGGLTDVS